MYPTHFARNAGEPTAQIMRISDRHWHALADDEVVGRGEASPRPDGRLFLSIDAWHDAVFDQLAQAMLAGLPKPLFTIVDETDHDLRAQWDRAGFSTGRREWELLLPSGPHLATPPPDVKIVGVGRAERDPLRELDRAIRAEVEASAGWHTMPAEVLVRLDDATVVDPAKYAVAAQADRYVGLIRLAQIPRQPRIGLIAVRADQQRRGIARALLAHVLDSLHRVGIHSASAEVDDRNLAAMELFESLGATRVGRNLELVCR
ncbi:GNAT family N-acetyltransferase [Hamadaea sp. NPDC051192]|uniref:GNAT family N-acetyltransferase n=1 Tax=Hamadaea sp. NPDC051192 TaxID=3154940 RepID=UPI003412A4AB